MSPFSILLVIAGDHDGGRGAFSLMLLLCTARIFFYDHTMVTQIYELSV